MTLDLDVRNDTHDPRPTSPTLHVRVSDACVTRLRELAYDRGTSVNAEARRLLERPDAVPMKPSDNGTLGVMQIVNLYNELASQMREYKETMPIPKEGDPPPPVRPVDASPVGAVVLPSELCSRVLAYATAVVAQRSPHLVVTLDSAVVALLERALTRWSSHRRSDAHRPR